MRKPVFLLVALFSIFILRAQDRRSASPKIAYTLAQKNSSSEDSLTVSVSLRRTANRLPGARIVRSFSPTIYIVRLRASALQQLAADSAVIFINELHTPREELNSGTADLSLNGTDYAHFRFPQFGGAALHASVKERLFDTSDIDLRQRTELTGLENNTVTAHASLMATIIGGAGNSSPLVTGSAPKSILSSASFDNLFPDADATLQRYSVSVQNHSYGTVVESFYGNEAAAYDAQANRLPSFLPVFSSGNSGDATATGGIYTGVAAMANLTGNFKQGKNVITVGSTDSAGNVMALSSRGPAYDGRIKPELVAYGEDGSSGASALVSGAALLVQDAYRQANNRLPSTALIRAALFNSADDAGTPHVDYLTGYGSLNTYKAIATIKDQHYAEGTIAPSALASFSLTVPAGLSRVKVTLAWNDPAALPNATKALVNDLDLQLVLPATGESWKPWVTDPTANLSNLLAPAQRKTDTLNNAEQVTIDLPAAGTYRIEVRGTRINTVGQDFAFAYQYDTANLFYWTYPNASTTLVAGLARNLRWQGTVAGTATIEYATSGNNWRSLGTVNDLSAKYFRWPVPDTTTTAVLRLRTNNATYLSDTFTISPQLRPRVGFNCTDSFLLYWNKLTVPQYRLYQLDGPYISAFAQTPDTAAFLSKAQHPSIYYAVAPIINGREGLRSNTLNYPAEGTACYIGGFFLDYQQDRAAFFSAELGTLFNVAQAVLERRTANGYTAIATIDHPSATTLALSDPSLLQGENHYRIAVRLANGTTVYSDDVVAYYLPTVPVLVYPNPVSQQGRLQIITNEAGRYTVQFIDISGRVLKQQLLTGSVTTIEAANLIKGFYLVRVLDHQKTAFVQKLIIQ